jgi:DNA-binding beta-propeller fold protein YncE
MRSAVFLLAILGLTTGLAAASRVHVSLVGHPPVLTAGEAWTARLAVRPKSFRGAVRVTATGPARAVARAKKAHGSYRVRLVLRRAGTWRLTARAGGSTSPLGSVRVKRGAAPLVFVYPTSIAIEPSGSVLIVENGRGRVLRVDPATATETVVASQLSRPYSVAATASGQILLSTENTVVRLASGVPQVVASMTAQIGPIALASNGDLYFTTATTAFRVKAGTHDAEPILEGLAGPHGLAIAADGALLVSDTEHDALLRVEVSTGTHSTLARLDRPGGLAVGPDGRIFVCDTTRGRVVHLTATGNRIGFVGPVFDTPYALAAAPDGGIYVAEAAATGHVRHVAPDGKVTTLSSG